MESWNVGETVAKGFYGSTLQKKEYLVAQQYYGPCDEARRNLFTLYCDSDEETDDTAMILKKM